VYDLTQQLETTQLQLDLAGAGASAVGGLQARVAELEATIHTLIQAEAVQRTANARQMIENRELRKRTEALQHSSNSGAELGNGPVQVRAAPAGGGTAAAPASRARASRAPALVRMHRQGICSKNAWLAARTQPPAPPQRHPTLP